MQNKLLYFCLFIGCLSAFDVTYAGDRKTCNGNAPGENIYKHYTGTIGNRNITLDLRYGYCGASNYGGSYLYYADGNETKCLMISEPGSFAHNAELRASEVPISNEWIEEAKQPQPTWSFVIKEDHLTGMWQSADKKSAVAINLVEDYSNAVRCDIMSYEDSAQTMQPGKPMRSAYFRYLGIKPSANMTQKESYLINGELLKITGTDKQGVTELENMSAAIAQQRFNEFTRSYGLLPDDTSKMEWQRGNFYYYSTLFPVYNNNGILSLELEHTGTMASTYTCIDIARNKTLSLNDIVKTDADKLTSLIRSQYRSTAGIKTVEAFPAEKMGFPEQFMVTGKGLVFCYPYDTGHGYSAEIRVFISYAKMGSLLTNDFRTRMGL